MRALTEFDAQFQRQSYIGKSRLQYHEHWVIDNEQQHPPKICVLKLLLWFRLFEDHAEVTRLIYLRQTLRDTYKCQGQSRNHAGYFRYWSMAGIYAL